MSDKSAALRAGAMDVLPIVPAVLAWGLVTGVATVQSGLDLPKAYGLSVLTFAGSAQLAVLPLLVGHAPIWITVLTALMVNLRFVIYSAALKGELGGLPLRRRLAFSYLIGDMPFVIFLRNMGQYPPPLRPTYFLGLGVGNILVWHIGSFAGLLAAGRIPAEWNLDFAGMLALLALLVPLVASRAGLAACTVGGTLGVLLDGLPAHTGLVIATTGGIAAALAAERLAPARP